MDKKIFTERKARMDSIQDALKGLFPEVGIALNYSNTWELLVAVVLSAQCTDVRVNQVTEELFKKYKTLDDYARVSQEVFEQDIRPTGFFRNKAKNIIAAASMVQGDFGGKVPNTMDELITIPGVARKTANVVLGNAFGVAEGIAVDTHVKRYAQKLNLSNYKDPIRIERDLMELVPKEDWNTITYRFIEYGRQICPARKHDCGEHPLTLIYPKAANIWPKAK